MSDEKKLASEVRLHDVLDELGKLSLKNGDKLEAYGPAHCVTTMMKYFEDQGIATYADLLAHMGMEGYAPPPGDCPCCHEPLSDWIPNTYTTSFYTDCNNDECMLYHGTSGKYFSYAELRLLRELDHLYKHANGGRWMSYKLKGILLSWASDAYPQKKRFTPKERIRRLVAEYDEETSDDDEDATE